MTRVAILLLALVALPGLRCDRDPQPPMPATGGASATGGAPGTGGTTATGSAAGMPGTGGAAPTPLDDCEAAEWRLADLECRTDAGVPLWQTPAGTPLAEVCRRRAADGDPLCARCLSTITDCSQIPACKPTSPGVCP